MFTLYHACVLLSIAVGLFLAEKLVNWLIKEDARIIARRKNVAEMVTLLAPLADASDSPVVKKLVGFGLDYSTGDYKDVLKDFDHFVEELTDNPVQFRADAIEICTVIAAAAAQKAAAVKIAA